MSHESTAKSDEYYTPEYVMKALGCTFDMDVASPVDRKFCHVKAQVYLTERSLESKWVGFVWMNPPYTGRNSKTPWLDKIYSHGTGIALVPDRTSAPWWQRAARQANAHLHLAEKIKFIKKSGEIAKQPGNGTTLFAYGNEAVKALYRAEINGLGTVFKR